MATLAGVFGKLFANGLAREAELASAEAAGNRLRAFPNEEILFYVKRIDNSRVVRAADPAARGTCWKTFAGVMAAAVFALVVLLPSALGLLEGRELRRLHVEQEQLLADQAALQVQEASVMTPAYMLKLAKAQGLVDPATNKVVYLQGERDTEFASIPAANAAGR